MAERYLLDTGIVVALADPDDDAHHRCSAAWREVRGEIYTCEGVLVESVWLLRNVRNGPRTALGLMHGATTRWAAPSEHRYTRTLELMERYRNVPMDFVDATLVALAEEHDIENVLTLDRRGFGVYRFGRNRRFKLLP